MQVLKNNIIIATYIFINVSCIGETTNNCCNPIDIDDNKYCVTFSGSYNSMETKSSSVIAEGVISSIYIYNYQEHTKQSLPINNNNTEYKSDSCGYLYSQINKELFLIPGKYDLYSISSNSNIGLSQNIEYGVLKEARNGTDYIWKYIKGITIEGNRQISITYKRLMSSICINFIDTSYSKILITKVQIEDKDIFGEIDISSGSVIKREEVNNEFISMQINGLNANIIIAPQIRELGIQLIIDYKSKNRINRVYGKIYQHNSKGFESGKKYHYNAYISDDKVDFSCNGIEDWVIDNNIELEL